MYVHTADIMQVHNIKKHNAEETTNVPCYTMVYDVSCGDYGLQEGQRNKKNNDKRTLISKRRGRKGQNVYVSSLAHTLDNGIRSRYLSFVQPPMG